MDKSNIIRNGIILILVLLTNYKITAQNIPYNNLCGNDNWRVAWHDEFDFLDTNKWEVRNNRDQWGKIGPCVCIDDNVSVSGGHLKLELKKETYQCPVNTNDTPSYYCYKQRAQASQGNNNYYYNYTAGSIVSKCVNNVNYGYLEARIAFPDEPGSTSCFWTLDTHCDNLGTNAGEIDIVEVWGDNQNMVRWDNIAQIWRYADQYSTNVHLSYDGTDADRSEDKNIWPPTDIKDFNIYGLMWDENILKFYFNGTLIRTMVNPQINSQLDIIFNNWLNASYSPLFGLFYNFSNNIMYVDWIRVYEPTVILAKAPYLINPKDDSNNSGKKQATIMWQLASGTSSSTQCTISWGSGYSNTATVYDNTTTDHLYSYDLTNLLPNTNYNYKVEVQGGITYTGNFNTPPLSNSTITSFYATGNRAINGNSQSINNLNDVLNTINTSITGDPSSQTFIIQTNSFVSGTNKALWRDEFFKSSLNWEYLRKRLFVVGGISQNERMEKCLDENDVPQYDLGIGNAMNFHTYLPFDYINPYLNNQQDFNYDLSMDYGPVHICFPEITEESFSSNDLSLGFIDSDLGNTTRDWKVLSFNFPLKSLNGDVVDSAAYTQIRLKAINNNVQLVLMGHEDYYAHWVDNNIHFIILGNGGSTTNSIDVQKLANDNDLVQASTAPHYTKFSIDGDMMYVDVKQGADYNGYTKGRTIEKFAIPKSCIINSTTVWNTGSYPIITDYVQVGTGGNLKIETEVQILKGNLIRVNKGGVLNLTGNTAKLTSVDAFTENLDLVTKDGSGNVTSSYKNNYTKQASYWEGVELNSDPTETQISSANQGVMYVNNGAIIENANVGVAIKQLVLENGSQVWKGGGILYADNSTFRNNISDIKMFPYQAEKTIGGGNIIKLSNRTRFTRCNFITTNDFLDNTKTIKHIVLNGVKGVLLYGNTFDNTSNSVSGIDNGIGIIASESSFRLSDESHYFFNQINDNTFNNLSYGVKAYNSAGKGNTYIKGCTFTNSNVSIYLGNSFNTNVIDNNISVPNYSTKANVYPYGIYIDGGTDFRVENNTLNIGDAMPVTFGIVINSTGANNNQIYRNTLNGFNVAIQPIDKNFGENSNGENVGLHLFCNNYNGVYDNWIGKSTNYSGDVGIAADQQMSGLSSNGSPVTFPAGNSFSTTYRMAAYDYDNTVGNNPDGLYFYYDQNEQNAEPTYISNVITVARTNSNTCPDKFNNGGTPINVLNANLANAQIALNSSRTILAIWKDGGNANLHEQVKTTQPWDVYVEFNNLIAESPYLSDEVLIETINNQAFTSLMIKLLMMANPQASRNGEIMNMIYERIPEMPRAYITAIENGRETVSQLDLLKNNVSADYNLLRSIGADIISNYKSDTISGNSISNLVNFVATRTDLADKYQLANIYLQNGDYTLMNNVIDNITSNFELNDQETQIHNSFITTYAIAQEVYSNDEYENVLNETQKASLEAVLNTRLPQVSQMALALLIRNNIDYEYTELVLQPSVSSAKIINNDDNKNVDEDVLFNVYPNPTTDYFTLEYSINKEEYSVLKMEIYDATGRIIKTKNLELNDNALLIDVSTLSKGIYTISFIADTKVLSVKKLTIIK